MLIVAFLLHVRSAIVPILTLPLAVLISFIPMYVMGIGMNIMSLGGIIVAIGDMVDAAIVMVDNAHKRLEEWERGGKIGDRLEVLIASAKEVGPPIFASVLVIAISFIPVFALEARKAACSSPWPGPTTWPSPCARCWPSRSSRPASDLHSRKDLSGIEAPCHSFAPRLYAPVLRAALHYRKAVIIGALVLMVEHRAALPADGFGVYATAV